MWRGVPCPSTSFNRDCSAASGTKQYGPQLPFNTDSVIARAVAVRAAAALGGRALVAPTLQYGASGEHVGFS
jgi:creatinine amidohydrolase/Fe(II)-dependent formamide hydrolase-like protein